MRLRKRNVIICLAVALALAGVIIVLRHGRTSQDEEFYRTLDSAIRTKNAEICTKVFATDPLFSNVCLFEFYQHFPDVEVCLSMNQNGEVASLWYRDQCFSDYAVSHDAPTYCQYVSVEARPDCETGVADNTLRRTKLCPTLYRDRAFVSPTECSQYVYSLHDPERCQSLTPAWNREKCLEEWTRFTDDLRNNKNSGSI